MGMYDYVDNKIMQKYIKYCPYCGKEFNNETEWQTKDFYNILTDISEKDFEKESYISIIGRCNHCGTYIDIIREKKDYIKVEVKYNIFERKD